MNPFAWMYAKTIAEAASAASTTVAKAMTVPPDVMDHGETVDHKGQWHRHSRSVERAPAEAIKNRQPVKCAGS